MQVAINHGVLSPWEPGIFSLVIFGVLILALIGLLLLIASWIGEITGNNHALDNLMGVAFQNHPVHKSTGVSFIGIAYDILWCTSSLTA